VTTTSTAPTVVAAAITHIGNVREHNEDSHWVDDISGSFVVCDGMGGHAAGEVASARACEVVRERWTAPDVQTAVDACATDPGGGRRSLLRALRAGVLAAHEQIVAESLSDLRKRGMGTTFVGLKLAGSHGVLAHAGDSRAYLVRDGIAEQLTEDHTLLARLAAAGVDVGVVGDGSRWRGVLTNALGIGDYTKVSTMALPLAAGDRFLLCSDGVSEYVSSEEIGAVLSAQPSPSRAAQRLVDLALERGGADNATALVVKVLEAGALSGARRREDDNVLSRCRLIARLTQPQRLRALRLAVEHELAEGATLPASTADDRLSWIILDGEIERGGGVLPAGSLIYPESLLVDRPPVDSRTLGKARTPVRALAIGQADFGELTVDEPDLAEPLFQALAEILSPGAVLA
jgi:serine/threonine protein phosphatase PrpC